MLLTPQHLPHQEGIQPLTPFSQRAPSHSHQRLFQIVVRAASTRNLASAFAPRAGSGNMVCLNSVMVFGLETMYWLVVGLWNSVMVMSWCFSWLCHSYVMVVMVFLYWEKCLKHISNQNSCLVFVRRRVRGSHFMGHKGCRAGNGSSLSRRMSHTKWKCEDIGWVIVRVGCLDGRREGEIMLSW